MEVRRVIAYAYDFRAHDLYTPPSPTRLEQSPWQHIKSTRAFCAKARFWERTQANLTRLRQLPHATPRAPVLKFYETLHTIHFHLEFNEKFHAEIGYGLSLSTWLTSQKTRQVDCVRLSKYYKGSPDLFKTVLRPRFESCFRQVDIGKFMQYSDLNVLTGGRYQ